MELRPYQEDAVNSIFSYFHKNYGNPILALPTGTGKSVILAEFIRRALAAYPQTRIVMCTHVQELIEQNFDKLMKLWPTAPAGIYSAGLARRDVGFPITYAGIGSIAKRVEDLGRVDLFLIDECHLVSHKNETMYASVIDALLRVNPHLKVIGFTATPFRLGLGMLTEGQIFTDICFDLTSRDAFNRLIEEGYLCRLVPKSTKTLIDVDTVTMHGGEFVQKELQQAVDKEALTSSAVDEMMHQALHRDHWLVFASGIEHAEHISDTLNDRGVKSTVIHGNLDRGTRRERLAAYKAGRFRCVVNYNVLTTGFDYPNIDMIGVLRPTGSPGLWVQMLGRGTRPLQGKENCLVLDFAKNTQRLGPINDPMIPKAKGKRDEKGRAPVKICGACDTYVHASVRICPECGFVFPANYDKYTQEASKLALIAAASLPQTSEQAVGEVHYSIHTKLDKPPSMKVTYTCGFRQFNEYVCFEHGGLASTKARQWWSKRSTAPCPALTSIALLSAKFLPIPKMIRVWEKPGNHSEVLSHVF